MRGDRGDKTQYCLSCGDDVSTYRVEAWGDVEIRCAYCGYTLSTARTTPDATSEVTLDVVSEATPVTLESILVVDDDVFFRNLLSDILNEQWVVNEVVPCESGAALLTECVRRFRDGRPVTLVILDIVMSPMDGAAAALALRALEQGFDLPAPVPILFVSGVRADDSLRQVIEDCAPALYLNKGKDTKPPQLAHRLEDIIPRLLNSVRAG
ncbi:MAG: response regulator [Candidatus Methylomirabilales bacterium]